ncbi:MAG: hypothetical protein ABR885_10145, partial [Mycobacterium sp.]
PAASHPCSRSVGQQPPDLLADPQRLGASHHRGDAAGRHDTARDPADSGGIAVLRQDGATHPGTYIGPLELAD